MPRLYVNMFPRGVQVECPMQICHLRRQCQFKLDCADGTGFMLVHKKRNVYKPLYDHQHERHVIAHVGRIALTDFGIDASLIAQWSDDMVILKWQSEEAASLERLSELTEEYMQQKFGEAPF